MILQFKTLFDRHFNLIRYKCLLQFGHGKYIYNEKYDQYSFANLSALFKICIRNRSSNVLKL